MPVSPDEFSGLELVELASRTPSMRFILTTREHLLQQALRTSERLHREAALLTMRRCVLEVGDYNFLDRARILYNHVYFGDLGKEYRSAILANDFYIEILRHRNFNPRLVEWLSRLRNVRHVAAQEYRAFVEAVLERPSQLWASAFESQVNEAGRSMLLALYALGGSAEVERQLRSAWESLHQHRAVRHNFSTSAEEWQSALLELDGGFLTYEQGRASFVNPSVKDFFDEALCQHEVHALDIMVSAGSLQTFMGVWSLAASERGTLLLQKLQRKPAPIEAALRRLVLNKENDTSSPVGDAEGALLAVVRVATALTSRSLREVAEEILGHLDDRWRRYGVDYPSLVATLEVMEEVDLFWGSIVSVLRQAMIDSLADQICWSDGFSALARKIHQG